MFLLCCLSSTAALQPVYTRRDVVGATAAAAIVPAGAPCASAADARRASSVVLADGAAFPLASFGLQIYDDATADSWLDASCDDLADGWHDAVGTGDSADDAIGWISSHDAAYVREGDVHEYDYDAAECDRKHAV